MGGRRRKQENYQKLVAAGKIKDGDKVDWNNYPDEWDAFLDWSGFEEEVEVEVDDLRDSSDEQEEEEEDDCKVSAVVPAPSKMDGGASAVTGNGGSGCGGAPGSKEAIAAAARAAAAAAYAETCSSPENRESESGKKRSSVGSSEDGSKKKAKTKMRRRQAEFLNMYGLPEEPRVRTIQIGTVKTFRERTSDPIHAFVREPGFLSGAFTLLGALAVLDLEPMCHEISGYLLKFVNTAQDVMNFVSNTLNRYLTTKSLKFVKAPKEFDPAIHHRQMPTLVVWDKKMVSGFTILDRWMFMPDNGYAETFYMSWVETFTKSDTYCKNGKPEVYFVTWRDEKEEEKERQRKKEEDKAKKDDQQHRRKDDGFNKGPPGGLPTWGGDRKGGSGPPPYGSGPPPVGFGR